MTVAVIWAVGWFVAGLFVAWGLREILWLSLASKHLAEAVAERREAIQIRQEAEGILLDVRDQMQSRAQARCFIGGGEPGPDGLP